MLQILCYNLHHLQDGLSVAGIACKSYQWMLNRHMSCQSVMNLARRPQNQNIGTLFYYFSAKLNDDNVWFEIGWVVISMVYLMLEDSIQCVFIKIRTDWIDILHSRALRNHTRYIRSLLLMYYENSAIDCQ